MCACACRVLCVPGWRVSLSHLPLSPQSAAECSSLLRTLHSLEQEHLRRSLALQQEEDFAKARRQLAIFQRNELHSIFFAQIKSAIFKGDLKPEAAKMLLQDYSKIQVMPPATPPWGECSRAILDLSSPSAESRSPSALLPCCGCRSSLPAPSVSA